MAIEFTKIKLKAEWLGHPKGSVLTINKIVADKLFIRQSAIPFDKEEKGAETKDTDSLDKKDKMMRPVRRKRL